MSKIDLRNCNSYEEICYINDNSVDLVIIDPPYQKKGNGYYCGGGAFGSNKRNYHSELDENNLLVGVSDALLAELVRVMKKVNIYIWCNKDQIYQYLDFFKDYNVDILTWHKTNPTPTCNNKYLSDTEYLLFFRENGVKINGNYSTKRKFYVTPVNKADKIKYGHPTVKPLSIIENLVINSSDDGQTVLDCFMGSGTTGVACAELNRNFIGMEINEEYFNIAKNRIEESEKQQDEQMSLFE